MGPTRGRQGTNDEGAKNMKRFSLLPFHKPLHCLLPLLLAALMLVGTTAHAAVYDHFDTNGIDTGLWTVGGAGFSQPGDSYLWYHSQGSGSQSLISTGLFTSGIFTMAFSDYACNNSAPGGRGLGSVAGFRLGTRESNNWVRIERGQIRSGGYLEVNWVIPDEPGNPIHVNWLPSEASAGLLQVRYDGTAATFFYRTAGGEWTQVVETYLNTGLPVLYNGLPRALEVPFDPGAGVPMSISALNGGNPSDQYYLDFKVDYVNVDAVPLPPSLLLLAPGVAGLAVIRRRLQK